MNNTGITYSTNRKAMHGSTRNTYVRKIKEKYYYEL